MLLVISRIDVCKDSSGLTSLQARLLSILLDPHIIMQVYKLCTGILLYVCDFFYNFKSYTNSTAIMPLLHCVIEYIVISILPVLLSFVIFWVLIKILRIGERTIG